ncbi:TetR/AcrR family transcriptional regulator [Enterococcus sp. LJL120]
MTENKQDLRFYRTKRNILNGMIALLERKSFEKITVKDICQEAEISRSAFYLHYVDKYQMIEAYQKELISQINQATLLKENFSVKQIITELLTFFTTEGKLLALLISDRGSIEIQNHIKEAITANMVENLLPRIQNIQLQSPLEQKYFIAYLSSAQFGVFQAWINGGQQESPAEMAAIIAQINKFDIR